MTYDTGTLPAPLRAAVEGELAPGERLLWTGRPDPKRAAGGTIGVLVFGIPWTAFSLFWTASAFAITRTGHGTPEVLRWIFPLWGVPFVLVGVGMLLSPLAAARKARETAYAVTDRRVLIVCRLSGGRIGTDSFVPLTAAGMKRRDLRDGRGDLTLPGSVGNTMRMSVGGHAVERRAPVTPMTFYGIPDAAGVERLIADTFGVSTANVVGDSGLPSNGVGALPAHLGLAPRPAALDRQAATAADEFPPPPYAADR